MWQTLSPTRGLLQGSGDSTPLTEQSSQFWRPLLRRKGVHLNITTHFPTPSNQSIDTILWTSGRALGGDVSEAGRSREIPNENRCLIGQFAM